MLDAILSPEWEYRYYSFDCRWKPDEELASMRNGSGDEWFLLLNPAGAVLKGFAHELGEHSFAQNIHSQIPHALGTFLDEPAFSVESTTFCYWREAGDSSWSKAHGALAEDGSEELLASLISGPTAYQRWAEDYYECSIDPGIVAAIFAQEPLTESAILALNSNADTESIFAEASAIGYPQNQ